RLFNGLWGVDPSPRVFSRRGYVCAPRLTPPTALRRRGGAALLSSKTNAKNFSVRVPDPRGIVLHSGERELRRPAAILCERQLIAPVPGEKHVRLSLFVVSAVGLLDDDKPVASIKT